MVRYSTPIGESELEWLSLGSSSSSSEQNSRNTDTEERNSSKSDLGYWQRDDRFKGTNRRHLEVHSASDFGWSRSSYHFTVLGHLFYFIF